MTYRLVTFDVYSALMDLEKSLLPELARVFDYTAGDVELPALLRTWRAKQLEYTLFSNSLHRGHIPFREITRRALEYSLRRSGLDLSEEQRAELVAAWDRLQPWPEAEAVVAEVKARGYPVAVLSNGDEVMLRALLSNFSVPFDYIFAADQAGVYKPHPAIYHLPLDHLGLLPAEVLHVAGSGRDVMGARAAGLACAWSNRSGDVPLDLTYAPTCEFPDLTGLLDVL